MITILCVLCSILIPICGFFLLKMILAVWVKNRDQDFKEYTYNKKDMEKRTILSFKIAIMFIVPVLLLCALVIFTFVELINSLEQLTFKPVLVCSACALGLLVFVCEFFLYKRIVSYDEYHRICTKYTVVYERIPLEILNLVLAVYCNVSFIIFIIALFQ